MSGHLSRWKPDPVLVAIIVIGGVLRVVALGEFPEVEADEGLWTNSSKNYALFGDWFMDGRTHMLLSPVFHLITVASFRLFGAGIASARLVSALAGTISIVLVFALVRRLGGSREAALVSSALFAVSEFAVVLSRRALIEPMQLGWVLAAAVVVTRNEKWAAPVAGVLFGIAVLTKINALFFLPVVAICLLAGWLYTEPVTRAARFTNAASFAAFSIATAGVVYFVLYRQYPELFTRAYVFEVVGAHFSGAEPIIRLGRFGIDPTFAARTILELLREDAFLIVLASMGAGIALVTGPRHALFFGTWAVVGTGFVLIQLFQPLRYLYLTVPAYAYLATLPLLALGRGLGDIKLARPALAALTVFVMFEIGNLGMNAVANGAVKVQTVRDWATATLDDHDRVLAAGYLCTDLPVPAYAHYLLANTPAQLMESIRKYQITYVIYDAAEWRPEFGRLLADLFQPVAKWSFGVAYRVDPAALLPPQR